MFGNNLIAFEKVHEIYCKSTPSQIMLYQAALNLHKILQSVQNDEITFENVMVLNQLVCTSRQSNYDFKGK